jgi:hypothetical protein
MSNSEEAFQSHIDDPRFPSDLQLAPGKRGRPQGKTQSPFGKLILRAMRLLEMSYQDIVSESRRLAIRNANPAMRIGKSTLGNIITGSITQPAAPKLDSLRIILHLSPAEMDVALGLQPERRFIDQLEMRSPRTHQVSLEDVTRQRFVRVPILRADAALKESRFLDSLVDEWATVEVGYLAGFYPPHFVYAILGDQDTFASPVAPPGTRLLVNTFLTKIGPAENTSFHLRPLFLVLTGKGFTCTYLETGDPGKVVLVPHPLSGHFRIELPINDVTVIGEVVGLLFTE